MVMINALRVTGRVLLAATAATGLAACDQPVAAPTQPRPVATAPATPPDARATERGLREILAELVSYSNTPEGRAALQPRQEAAGARLDAVLASPPGSAERLSLDELLARLRALSAAPPPAGAQPRGAPAARAPATGSR
jgi:hypothetical protein